MKIFVAASAQARAQRRALELIQRGEKADYQAILADIIRRDARDSNRAAAPLRPAGDAVLLDTTHLGIDAATAEAVRIVEAARIRVLAENTLFDQRTDVSLGVQGGYSGVNGPVEIVGVGEGLVGQMMGFEIAPDELDVVELGRVLGQPFDGEPMGAGAKRGGGGLAHVDRPIVEHHDDRR